MPNAIGVGIGPVFADTSPGANRFALTFDGSDDEVVIANESNFDFERTDSFTVELWIKTTDDQGFLVSKQRNFSTTFEGWSLVIGLQTANKLVFQLANDNLGGDRIVVETTTSVNTGAWIHCAVTYDGSSTAAGVAFYLNGVLDTPNVIADGLTASILNATPVHLGARAAGSGGQLFYAGNMDGVRIWDVKRTGTEILGAYRSRIDKASGLIGSWGCEELEVISSGAVIPNAEPNIGAVPLHRLADSSGNDNHGTFTNFPNGPFITAEDGLW